MRGVERRGERMTVVGMKVKVKRERKRNTYEEGE